MMNYVVGDTKPDYEFTVDREGAPVNLAAATSVTFKLYKPSGAVVSRDLSKVDGGITGRVAGAWGEGDLDEAGEMYGDVVVDWGSGNLEHGLAPVRVHVREEGSV